MKQKSIPEKRKSQKSKEFIFDLVVMLIIATFPVYVYHLFFVKPILKDLDRTKIYVFDSHAFIKQERKQLLQKILQGENFSPREVEKKVRSHLDFLLSGLPENVIILDSSCVLHGGVKIPLKGEKNATRTLTPSRPPQ